MPRIARVDANQKAIVSALRKAGASVQSLATVGDGCPDLVVGFRGDNYLLEIKDGNKSPSKRQLREKQRDWHERWRGRVCVVENCADALAAIGAR